MSRKICTGTTVRRSRRPTQLPFGSDCLLRAMYKPSRDQISLSAQIVEPTVPSLSQSTEEPASRAASGLSRSDLPHITAIALDGSEFPLHGSAALRGAR